LLTPANLVLMVIGSTDEEYALHMLGLNELTQSLAFKVNFWMLRAVPRALRVLRINCWMHPCFSLLQSSVLAYFFIFQGILFVKSAHIWRAAKIFS
jgi:hypothetical protein